MREKRKRLSSWMFLLGAPSPRDLTLLYVVIGGIWLTPWNGFLYPFLPAYLHAAMVTIHHWIFVGLSGWLLWLLTARMAHRLRYTEDEILRLATHDHLTGLLNRRVFNERVDTAIRHTQRLQGKLAVLFLDLDRFKVINDTHGHTVGDSLLVEAAERMTSCCPRATDFLGRIGGDEFVICLGTISSTEDAGNVAERILSTFASPFSCGGRQLFVGASIGIAVFPGDGSTTDELVQAADMAMYRAKEEGRNTYRFFSRAIQRAAMRKLLLEQGLRAAVEKEELGVVFQPKIMIPSQRVIGFEALARLNHPQLGAVPPEEFIPVAEEHGLIIPLTQLVLEKALQELHRWHECGYHVTMSVNVSPRHLISNGIQRHVEKALRRHQVPPCYLEIEITEKVMMSDPEKAREVIDGLARMGVGVHVDDFGTGYCSLAYLRRFPWQALKIDRSLVQGVATNQDDAAIALAMINLGQSLNLRVIAEGVESEDQLRCLRSLDCTEMQGFLFSRPLSAEGAMHALITGAGFVGAPADGLLSYQGK